MVSPNRITQNCPELKIFPNERTPKKHSFKKNPERIPSELTYNSRKPERTIFVNSKNQKRFQGLMLKLILKPNVKSKSKTFSRINVKIDIKTQRQIKIKNVFKD